MDVKKLHGNRGHASASQLKRTLACADGVSGAVLKVADSVGDKCDVRADLDQAPHLPAAGTSLVSAFNEEVQVDVLPWGNLVALHAMDFYRHVFDPGFGALGESIGGLGRFREVADRRFWLADSGGEWKNEVRTGSRPERNISLQLQGKGANSWMLERRNGLARGILYESREGGRFVDMSILNDGQYCLNAVLNHAGFSAYRMAFGSNSAHLFLGRKMTRTWNLCGTVRFRVNLYFDGS